MQVAIIVQARMGSTRLPGKTLKKIAGLSVLERVVQNLRQVVGVNCIVVATTTNSEDSVIVEEAKRLNVRSFRGSQADVLDRYLGAARQVGADLIIRVCADCPMIDAAIISQMLLENRDLITHGRIEYVSNTIVRTFPKGLDAEIFSIHTLQKAHQEATEQYDREHVTPYIYRHPERFRIKNYQSPNDYSSHRWTLDNIEDYKFLESLLSQLPKDYTTEQAIKYLEGKN